MVRQLGLEDTLLDSRNLQTDRGHIDSNKDFYGLKVVFFLTVTKNELLNKL